MSKDVAHKHASKAKNPAALAQIDHSSMSSLLQSLGAVVDAAGFATADHQKLIALVQAQGEDSDAGAPAAATYKSQSQGCQSTCQLVACIRHSSK